MNDTDRRKMDRENRENVFVGDNAADFPPGSPITDITAQIQAKAAEIVRNDAGFSSEFGNLTQAMSNKAAAREAVLDEDRDIVAAAVAVGNAAVPGITKKFVMPYPRSDQNIIADADAKYADTEPLEAQFIAVGLDTKFRQDLKAARDHFQAMTDAANSALEGRGDAVAALAALWRELGELQRRRSAMVKLKYRSSPGKLGAWAIASHLDRAPKRAPTATPQPAAENAPDTK